MKVACEKIVQRQTVLNIEVEEQDLEPYLSQAQHRLGSRLTVPGFRKGKAPRALVERMVGREALLNEALEFLVPEVTAQAVQDQGLQAVGVPDVEVQGLEPLVLKATVPLLPDVTLGDYGSVRVEFQTVEITEENIQTALEDLRRQNSSWEPVDRPVRLEDLLSIDVHGEVEGVRFFQEQDLTYVVSPDTPNAIIPVAGFAEALEGLESGVSNEFVLPFPEDYPNQQMAGKPCQFVVTVKEVKERKLPDLNDEFAQGVGQGFENLQVLKEDLREKIFTSKEYQVRREYEERAITAILGVSTVELPPILIERQLDQEVERLNGELSRVNLAMGDYLRQTGKTEEELREEMRPSVDEQLTRAFVLSKLGELEGIEIGDGEVDQEIERLQGGSDEQRDAIRRFFRSEKQRRSLGNTIRTNRTIERLVAITKGEILATTPSPERRASSLAKTRGSKTSVVRGGGETPRSSRKNKASQVSTKSSTQRKRRSRV